MDLPALADELPLTLFVSLVGRVYWFDDVTHALYALQPVVICKFRSSGAFVDMSEFSWKDRNETG